MCTGIYAQTIYISAKVNSLFNMVSVTQPYNNETHYKTPKMQTKTFAKVRLIT